jgi:5,10-methylenetetrahydromethanopterin reductase
MKILNLAKKLKFKCLWIGEDMDELHDVFVQASFALLNSSLIIGIGITSIFFRNISNIARAATSLYEIGKIENNERFRLGIGVGGIQVLSKMNIQIKKPLSAMRYATFLLRKIWSGEIITFNSEAFRLKSYYARYGLGQRIPIYFGVRGPKMLSLAGELANGVILSGPKTYLKKAVEIIKESIKKAGRSENDVNIVVWVPTILILREKDLELAKNVVAFVLADTPETVLKMSKINMEIVKNIQETCMRKGIDSAAKLVTNELLDEMVFYGDALKLCESFISIEKYGINEIVFGPPFGTNKEFAITQIAKTWRKIF